MQVIRGLANDALSPLFFWVPCDDEMRMEFSASISCRSSSLSQS
jgi:hypothetical protein